MYHHSNIHALFCISHFKRISRIQHKIRHHVLLCYCFHDFALYSSRNWKITSKQNDVLFYLDVLHDFAIESRTLGPRESSFKPDSIWYNVYLSDKNSWKHSFFHEILKLAGIFKILFLDYYCCNVFDCSCISSSSICPNQRTIKIEGEAHKWPDSICWTPILIGWISYPATRSI